MIKRYIAVILLSSILMSQTELIQVMKFPLLVTHFLYHKKENAKISMLDFIKMHYFSKTVRDKDYQQDMRLPFKSACFGQLLSSEKAIPENSYVFVFIAVLDIISVRRVYSVPLLSRPVEGVWQPPRSC